MNEATTGLTQAEQAWLDKLCHEDGTFAFPYVAPKREAAKWQLDLRAFVKAIPHDRQRAFANAVIGKVNETMVNAAIEGATEGQRPPMIALNVAVEEAAGWCGLPVRSRLLASVMRANGYELDSMMRMWGLHSLPEGELSDRWNKARCLAKDRVSAL